MRLGITMLGCRRVRVSRGGKVEGRKRGVAVAYDCSHASTWYNWSYAMQSPVGVVAGKRQ